MTGKPPARPAHDDRQGREAAAAATPRHGEAQQPERIPGVGGKQGKPAKSYEDLSEDEKAVADALSQDWDA